MKGEAGRMKRESMIDLKRKWLPLFVLGSAIFGAGLALGLLWLYRQSPFTDAVVDFLTPSPTAPPRGTLISITAALFTAVGGMLLLISIRRIKASEVGEIDSFWWKVAVAALAGQWWLGEPRLVVLSAASDTPSLLRALKTFSGRITVLSRPSVESVLALAEDEAAVSSVMGALRGEAEQWSDGLRLRGRFLPPAPAPKTYDVLARAEAFVCAPNLDGGSSFGLELDDQVARAIRQMRGRKILIGSVSAARGGALAGAVNWCQGRFGAFSVVLANNNSVLPLPPGRVHQKIDGAVERDLADWSAPESWDAAKLAVFLREAISRP